MTRYEIPFGKETVAVEIPPENLLFYAAPAITAAPPDSGAVIEAALDGPIGTERLETLVKPGRTIALLVDDITRPTPQKKLLPPILRRLEQAGVKRGDITVVAALGTHRPMSDEEIEAHIGWDTIRGCRLLNLDYTDESNFTYIGDTPLGTPIEIYRDVMACDMRIAAGNIAPHIAAGWGGGAKMIQPGVCSERTTEATHLMACTQQRVLDVCGNADNLCRREMESIAGQVGLDFIVNTVLDVNGGILGVYAGHYIEAHRAGVRHAEQVMCVPIPRQADIVIASANPNHIDFWQGCKPYIYAQYAVRDGGVLIFLIEGSEGLCGNAPQHEAVLRKYCLYDYETLKKEVADGLVEDIVGINVPLFHSTLRHRARTICVSQGMTREDAACLGFGYAGSVDAALEEAYRIMGPEAKVGVIPYGGETLTTVR
jgi:nickel-dependent lactate racemase